MLSKAWLSRFRGNDEKNRSSTDSFDFTKYPRRLNLGCGFDRLEGYLNVDLQAFHEPDLVADVADLGMLPSGLYEEIVAIDVLEHLPRSSTADVLREWHRLLARGGVLRLRVPSLEGLVELFRQSESFERHRELMQCLFGTQAYTGDFHLTSFTRVSIAGYLALAGFDLLALRIRDEWLFEAVATPADPDADRDGPAARLTRIGALAIDHRDFTEAVFRTLLERVPDPEGEAFYVGGLESGDFDRESVIGAVMGSEEFRSRATHAEATP
jgi:hypothetical protein